MLEDLVEQYPTDGRNHLRLAEALISLGDVESAVEPLCQARGLDAQFKVSERELLGRLEAEAGVRTHSDARTDGPATEMPGRCVWLGLTWALAGTGCADSQVRLVGGQGDVAGGAGGGGTDRAAPRWAGGASPRRPTRDNGRVRGRTRVVGGEPGAWRRERDAPRPAEVEAAMGLDGAAAQRFYLLARRGPRRATESPEGCALLVVRRAAGAARGVGGRGRSDLEAADLFLRGTHDAVLRPRTSGRCDAPFGRGGGGARRASTAAAFARRVGCGAWQTCFWEARRTELAGEGRPLVSRPSRWRSW